MPISNEVMMAGKFLTESLNIYDAQITDTVYPEYWGYEGLYHQAVGDLPFGALSYTTARRDYTGRAANFGGKAQTLPLANFGINMDSYKCLQGVLAVDWTWMELQAEEAAQQNPYLPRPNVIESYRRALEKGLRDWMHIRTIFGDPSVGFTGFLNNPYVETIDVAANVNPITGTGGTGINAPNAANAYDWFRRELSSFRKASRLTVDASVAFVSEDVRSALATRFADGTNDGTPSNVLTSRTESPALRTIETLNEFSGDIIRDPNFGGLTTLNGVTLPANFDLVLLTQNSVEDNIMRHFSDIQTLPPGILDDQMTYRQVGVCATSEVIFKEPFRARLYILRKS